MNPQLIDSCRKHEGFRSEPYLDTKGIPTIGIGRAYIGFTLEQVQRLFPQGCTEEQALVWLHDELASCSKDAWGLFLHYDSIDPVRQDVIIELLYNVGAHKLANFHKMITAINGRDWVRAGLELADSKWWTDVGEDKVADGRGKHLAYQLITGTRWQNIF